MLNEKSRVLLFEMDEMMQNLADYISSVDRVRLNETDNIDMKIARMLPENIAKRFCLIPIGEIDDRIVIAMANPLDVIAQDTVRLKLNREITVAVSSKEEILNAIESVYHGLDLEEQHLQDLTELDVGLEEKQEPLTKDAAEDMARGSEEK